ncbi:MAG: DNA-binding protein [Cyanobacteria bacterium DS2.3.42]|nr:DNA-binding protein [Cyanobacteria bacterium DS2.3.42]
MDNLIPFSPSQKTDAKASFSRFDNELLSRREAAAYLGIAENTLAIWKSSGRYSLPYIKLGRLVKYRRIDLDAFIMNRLHGGQ